jgi:N-glycosylase/DNA lyase
MILSSIDKDHWVNSAIQKLHGLRLIRQNPWECLISYICATNTNIPSIKNRILELSKRFGKEVTFDAKLFYAFPEPEELANATLDELRSCGLGYRAKCALETAKKIGANPDLLEAFKKLEYEELREELLTLSGVGPKVADCISLFAFDKLEAFPIDVWVRRVMYQRYLKKEIPKCPKTGRVKPLTGSEYDELRSFAWRYFGKYAGYAQQYLFYHRRIEESGRMSG